MCLEIDNCPDDYTGMPCNECWEDAPCKCKNYDGCAECFYRWSAWLNSKKDDPEFHVEGMVSDLRYFGKVILSKDRMEILADWYDVFVA